MNDNHKLGRHRRVLAIIGLMIFILVLLVIRLTLGQHVLEKLLTSVALPCGLIWVGLGLSCVWAMARKQIVFGVTLGGLFLLLSLAGNDKVGDWMMSRLESRYSPGLTADTPPVDLLVVLGGGSTRLVSGEAQLNAFGDRVMLGVRWYRAGRAKHLVATGASQTASGFDPLGGAKTTAEIWRELGVPDNAISVIGGRNTSQEMQELKSLLDQRPASRVGLVTSAWHMPRALRLGRSVELELVPVAADLRTRRPPGPVPALVPTAEALWTTSLAAKEYLAYLVGR